MWQSVLNDFASHKHASIYVCIWSKLKLKISTFCYWFWLEIYLIIINKTRRVSEWFETFHLMLILNLSFNFAFHGNGGLLPLHHKLSMKTTMPAASASSSSFVEDFVSLTHSTKGRWSITRTYRRVSVEWSCTAPNFFWHDALLFLVPSSIKPRFNSLETVQNLLSCRIGKNAALN